MNVMSLAVARSGVSLTSTVSYSWLAVVRRWRNNLPLHGGIAAATAVPTTALLVQSIILRQGSAFGGAQFAAEFRSAGWLVALMGAGVGLAQVQLLLGRALRQHRKEHQLLLASIMSPRQLLSTLLWECGCHAIFGALLGCLASVVIVLLLHISGFGDLPLLRDYAEGCAAGFLVAAVSVGIPCGSHLALILGQERRERMASVT